MEECNVNNTLVVEDHLFDYAVRFPITNILLGKVYPVIAVIGIILNIIFLTLVIFDKTMRTITNVYLVNLAIADLLNLLYSLGTSQAMLYITPFKESMPFLGSNGCMINFGVTYSLYNVTLFLVTLVSVERFMAICHPLLHRSVAGKWRTAKLCTACWVLSLAIGISQAYLQSYTLIFCLSFVTKFPGKAWKYQACTFPAYVREFGIASNLLEIIPFFLCLIGMIECFRFRFVWCLFFCSSVTLKTF